MPGRPAAWFATSYLHPYTGHSKIYLAADFARKELLNPTITSAIPPAMPNRTLDVR